MALVSAKEMLQKAKAGHYAVGQFNINNLEWTKAILLTAEECKSPVILGVSEGAGKYMAGYKTVVGMVNGMLEELNITVPVALHLDHGSYEGAKKCIEAGFSSIMFDGSHLPFEENVEKTKEFISCKYEKNFSYVFTSEINQNNIQKKVVFQKNLSAPIKKNQVIGRLEYSYNNKKIGTVSILASETVGKAKYTDYLQKLLLNL